MDNLTYEIETYKRASKQVADSIAMWEEDPDNEANFAKMCIQLGLLQLTMDPMLKILLDETNRRLTGRNEV